MSNLTLQLDTITVIVNVVIRIVTAILFLTLIIPLQVKEAGVKNGLRLLRKELLLSGIIIFLVNTIGLLTIVIKYFFGDVAVQTSTPIITLFNSIGFLAIGFIKLNIYHQQYTPENKRIHTMIAQHEIPIKKKTVHRKKKGGVKK